MVPPPPISKLLRGPCGNVIFVSMDLVISTHYTHRSMASLRKVWFKILMFNYGLMFNSELSVVLTIRSQLQKKPNNGLATPAWSLCSVTVRPFFAEKEPQVKERAKNILHTETKLLAVYQVLYL